MKKVFYLTICVALISCNAFVINEAEAKKTAEAILTSIQNEDYDKTSEYYSPEFNESETLGSRKLKFEKLKETCGKRNKFELTETKITTIDDREIIIFTYKISCDNVDLKDNLYIGLEEGKHLVLRHVTTNLEKPL